MDAGELLAELRRLAGDFPVPHPSWHRYVPEMREVVADLVAAIGALDALPAARAELARRLEDEAGDACGGGGPALAAARERLRELPLPEGEHPYLDEIAVTVDATRTALAALAAAAGGEEAFAARRGAR